MSLDLEYGSLVKNYLNDDIKYHVKRRTGQDVTGELTPGSHIEILGLNVGDVLSLWNDKVTARHVLEVPRNSKYIIAEPHMRKEILFKHQGYQPIIVQGYDSRHRGNSYRFDHYSRGNNYRFDRGYGRGNSYNPVVNYYKLEEKKQDHTTTIVIIILAIMLLFTGVALLIVAMRRSVSGGGASDNIIASLSDDMLDEATILI